MKEKRKQSTLFSAVYHARAFRSRDNEKGKTMTDTSGRNFRGWSEKLSLLGLWWRTYLESCGLPRTTFVRTWSVKATPLGYSVTKLRLSEPRIAGCASSLLENLSEEHASYHGGSLLMWRTPDAHSKRGAQSPERFAVSMKTGKQLTLNDQVVHLSPERLWATPKASDAITGATARQSDRPPEKTTHLAAQVHLRVPQMCPTPRAADGAKGQRTPEGTAKEMNRGNGIDLPMFAQLYPTPTVNGDYNRKGVSVNSGDGLATFVKKLYTTPTVNDSKNNAPPSQHTENGRHSNPLSVVAGGALNPSWVEWLMGFPFNWTDAEDQRSHHELFSITDISGQWEFEPDIPRVAKNIPNRVQRLKALGNAVVPAQVFPIFAAIAEIEARS